MTGPMRMPPVGVLGTGSYLPEREVPNSEVAAFAGVTAEWIERRTRIRSRRYADEADATSDLAARAARSALVDAGLDAADVDYLVVATSTPDSPQPPTAALVQRLLGAWQAACLDVNAVCSGFVYAMAIAHGLVAQHPDRRALVVAADVYSRILDPRDRATVSLFGDGAGAVVLAAVPEGRGVLGIGLHSRGDAHDLITVPAGGSRLPASHATVDDGLHYFAMRGREVAAFVIDEVPPALNEVLRRAGLTADQVDHFVPHQPNGNLLDDLVVGAGLAKATTHRTVERFGNIGCASVPVTLDVARRRGTLRDGDIVLLAGFGGGMAIGTCVMRWSVRPSDADRGGVDAGRRAVAPPRRQPVSRTRPRLVGGSPRGSRSAGRCGDADPGPES